MKRPTFLKRLGVWGICLLCLWLALPNAFYPRVDALNTPPAAGSPASGSETANWPSYLSSSLINLGLDLRGGAHLLAEVDVEAAARQRLAGLWPVLRDQLRETGGAGLRLSRVPTAEALLRIRLSDASVLPQAEQQAAALATTVTTATGLAAPDLSIRSEGSDLLISYSEAGRAALSDQLVAQSLEIIRRRIDEAGTREPSILRQGEDRIVIEVPGFSDAEALKALIGTTAQLSFHSVVAPGTGREPGTLTLPDATRPEVSYDLDPRPVVSGEHLIDAQAGFDQNGRPAVTFRFDTSGAQAFGTYTADHIGSPFAIVLDGQVLSAPVIQSHIGGGTGIITGQFTVEETTRLATLLRSGALPADLTFLEEKTIGPELGSDSVAAGLRAGMIGLAAVAALMVACYGAMGLLAVAALLINIVILMAALTLVGATLTLPGIAGIVLTLGMAVDANVLIFERIREELRQDRNLWRAVGKGFQSAFSSILDANLTGLITAGLMFWLGAGPVRGFAITLGFGILSSMFTALVVTRLMLQTWLEWRRPARLSFRGLFRFLGRQPHIDFFRLQWLSFGASATAMLGAGLLVATLGLNLGIDFTGGTSMRLESPNVLRLEDTRQALTALDIGDVTLSEVFAADGDSAARVADLRIASKSEAAALTADEAAKVRSALQSLDPDLRITASESIGGKVSPELIRAATLAVVGGVLAILAYVWLRFEWQFALGAVLALGHDILLTLGLFALLGLKVDLAFVAALLTILGYSINDTVVVFDRVRENLHRHHTLPLRQILNLSACETLSRTILTSATTLVALLALLVFGGDVIRGFALAITFGIVVGTYSSIYVAKNIVLFLGIDRSAFTARRKTTGAYDHISA